MSSTILLQMVTTLHVSITMPLAKSEGPFLKKRCNFLSVLASVLPLSTTVFNF